MTESPHDKRGPKQHWVLDPATIPVTESPSQMVVEAALDWFEREAAHAPDGGPNDPRDLRLYQILSDPQLREALRHA